MKNLFAFYLFLTPFILISIDKSIPEIDQNSWSLKAILSSQIPNSSEGLALAFSADGNTLAVGAPGNVFKDDGCVVIYIRDTNDDWDWQATLSQNLPQSNEGWAVALSSDGNILAVGAPNYQNNGEYAGCVHIYTISDSEWKYQQFIIRGGQLGYSVTLTPDGNILAAGAPAYNNWEGLTVLYLKSNGPLYFPKALLSQKNESSQEGYSVSLSADGKTLAVGAPFAFHINEQAGVVQIYNGTGIIYKKHATLSQSNFNGFQGHAVSLSPDGNTLAAGSFGLNDNQGGTEVYFRFGTDWKHQATLSKYSNASYEGSAVAVSPKSNLIAAGAPGYNNTGATQIYYKLGTGWKYQTTLSQYEANSGEGNSVAFSINSGNITVAAGSPNFNSTEGQSLLYTTN